MAKIKSNAKWYFSFYSFYQIEGLILFFKLIK
jgi:hypothetical protein